MSNKIGRNDPCPCGSGKKYKKCCYGREDNPEYSNPANFARNYKEMRKASRIKECIYPDHSSCSERIINAHSIQNNKILAKISDNGKVYMPSLNNLLKKIKCLIKIHPRLLLRVFLQFLPYKEALFLQRKFTETCV